VRGGARDDGHGEPVGERRGRGGSGRQGRREVARERFVRRATNQVHAGCAEEDETTRVSFDAEGAVYQRAVLAELQRAVHFFAVLQHGEEDGRQGARGQGSARAEGEEGIRFGL